MISCHIIRWLYKPFCPLKFYWKYNVLHSTFICFGLRCAQVIKSMNAITNLPHSMFIFCSPLSLSLFLSFLYTVFFSLPRIIILWFVAHRTYGNDNKMWTIAILFRYLHLSLHPSLLQDIQFICCSFFYLCLLYTYS